MTHLSGFKGEAGGMRSALEDSLAGWAQFRLPARRMNSARKSLPLAAVQILTVAPPASLPPALLIHPIQFSSHKLTTLRKVKARAMVNMLGLRQCFGRAWTLFILLDWYIHRV